MIVVLQKKRMTPLFVKLLMLLADQINLVMTTTTIIMFRLRRLNTMTR